MNRKALFIALAIVAYCTAAFFAACWVAGNAYFILNKTWPDGVTVHTWRMYWDMYANVPLQRKFLKLSALVAGILLYGVPFVIAASVVTKVRDMYGKARFATSAEIQKAGLFGSAGVIVAKWGRRYLILGGQLFVLLAAPTRSGKGVSVVIPNHLHYPDSMVTLDVKFEIFKHTSKFRQMHGHEVFLFAPFAEDGRTHRWNIFDTMSRDLHLRVADAISIGQIIWPSNTDPKEKFWNDTARNLFVAFTLYLLETPRLPLTMGEILRQGAGNGMPIKAYIEGIIKERDEGEAPLSKSCVDAFARFLSQPENTLGNTIATFNAPLQIFSTATVDAATSASDFDLSKVRSKRMTIYFGVQPPRLDDAGLLINLFYSRLVALNTKELPQNNPELKYQCLLVPDEMAAVGKISALVRGVSFIAGYNLRLLTIVQTKSQLESMFGKADSRTYSTNHACEVIFPPATNDDAKEYSEMLGYDTVDVVSRGISRPRFGDRSGSNSENVSQGKRALMLPQELLMLDESKAIVSLQSHKPIMAEKARFYEDALFIDRLKSVSPTLARLGDRLPTKEELDHVAFVLGELSVDVPVQDISLHMAKIEGRTRPLEPGEPIDLAKLALEPDELPPADSQEAPSKESVGQIVNAFFSQLEWEEPEARDPLASFATEPATDEPARSPPPNSSRISLAALDPELPEAEIEKLSTAKARSNAKRIDLAALDEE